MRRERQLKDALGGQTPVSGLSKDQFWSRFEARARVQTPAQEPAGWYWLLHAGSVRWGLGSVAAMIVVMGAFLFSGPSVQAGVGVVRELEIHGPYDSVMILEDTAAEGTFVWIDGI